MTSFETSAVIHGAEGTYCVVTHPAEVSKEVIRFLKKKM
jgi:hypothetical protein